MSGTAPIASPAVPPPAAPPAAPLTESKSSGVITASKLVPIGVVQREILAHDKFPRVRWHSARHVMLCRNSLQVAIFVLITLFSLLFGPSMLSVIYPNIILPFAPGLEWKCTPISSYIHMHEDHLSFKTSLMAAGVGMQIKMYSSDEVTTFDSLERILLVMDDCAFDHYSENVMLCRPYWNSDLRPSFEMYVKLAQNCYLYIRQITKRAKISAYGRGIAANALLAAAARLRADSCFHYEKLYLEDPIPDLGTEFDKSTWIGLFYAFPPIRSKLINDAMTCHGYEAADFWSNMKKVGKTPVYVVTKDKEAFANLKAPAKVITMKEMNQQFTAQMTNQVNKSFEFRHDTEKACAVELKKSVTQLHIGY